MCAVVCALPPPAARPGKLPEPMSTFDSPASVRDALRTLAGNFWFSWLPGARALVTSSIPTLRGSRPQPARARCRALQRRARRPGDAGLPGATPAGARDDSRPRRAADTWWERQREDDRFSVAYFSCEFGLDESLPIYSGGLGVLAGDHLKSASDLGVPLVGVGLLLPRGLLPPAARRRRPPAERIPRTTRHLPVAARAGHRGRRACR